MDSPKDVLISGYIREFEQFNKVNVPRELQKVVYNFYQMQIQIFGNGSNRYCQWGIQQNSIKQWTRLQHLSLMCQSPSMFFTGYNNFSSVFDKILYVIGSNRDNAIGMFYIKITYILNVYMYVYIYIYIYIGMNIDQRRIPQWTKVPLPYSTYNVQITNTRQCSKYGIVMLVHKQDNDDQIFYTFGENKKGQQGFISTIHTPHPKCCKLLTETFKKIKISDIVTGQSHTVFLSEQGQVFTTGNNQYGACGVPYSSNKSKIQPIDTITSRIKQISAGRYYSTVLDIHGQVWTFGSNRYGQLGNGNGGYSGARSYTPTVNKYLKKTEFINCGHNHTLSVCENGQAFLFGHNQMHQCGTVQEGTNVICKPVCINSNMKNDVIIKYGSCGEFQTILVTQKNVIYKVGECTMKKQKHRKCIKLIKRSDIGLKSHAIILKVICDCNDVLIISEMI